MAHYLSVTEFAERISVHPQTVRLWDRTGKLRAHHRTPGGKRFYAEDQVTAFLNSDPKDTYREEV